ncbi:TSCPD domain-containing protein (plasmid) [Geobacter anodireducens]|nr:TSCPD domain-containing protein [Geobacter anodireducens]
MSPTLPRSVVMAGHTIIEMSNCGKLFITINRDPTNGQPAEVFVRFGKAGGCGSAVMDGMSRMISYGLRSGMDPERVIKGLDGIGCHAGSNSCMEAVAKAFKLVLQGIPEEMMEVCP